MITSNTDQWITENRYEHRIRYAYMNERHDDFVSSRFSDAYGK